MRLAEADSLRRAAAVASKELQLERAPRDEVLHKYGGGDGATGGLTAAAADALWTCGCWRRHVRAAAGAGRASQGAGAAAEQAKFGSWL